MKIIGILFIFMFGAVFTSMKGYSNSHEMSIQRADIEDHSEKMYIKSSNLYFSDEGIFIKNCLGEWNPIGHIYHDLKGYYLMKTPSSHAQVIMFQNTKEKGTWICPSCHYENTSTNGVCERCLWPLYE